jgi:hypothetical protein
MNEPSPVIADDASVGPADLDAEGRRQCRADGAELAGVDDRHLGVDVAQGIAGHTRGRQDFLAGELLVEARSTET